MTSVSRAPGRQGLYDPSFEHDACGLGFVASLSGRRSHRVVAHALRVLVNLQHRGACAADATTGDGAGILIQMPDAFLRRVAGGLGIDLPAPGRYGAGLVFLPRDDTRRAVVRQACEALVREAGGVVLGWRPLPLDETQLGGAAAASRPVIEQLFVGLGGAEDQADPLAVERRLYVIRRRLELALGARAAGGDGLYLASLSARILVYKGMLRGDQLAPVFADLRDATLHSALALVHQRFSTNTFPSWPLAHPFRLIAHNGEINTLRGNVNWMRARQGLLQSAHFGAALSTVLPVIVPGGSDSATFDNVLELLVLSGRSLPHALLMMVPPPWPSDTSMPQALRAFYEYHSMFMEPWDGPAALAFSDGTQIGAMLDRNGLRPARYCVTDDGLVILASEAGVLDLPPASIVRRGRVAPGQIFLVDTAAGRIVTDDEIKHGLAAAHPYAEWVSRAIVDVDALPAAPEPPVQRATLLTRQDMFGYTQEDHELLLAPMADAGKEPIGSMGSDSALAVLSDRPRLLFDYFKQLFAQVTNPPLDAVREQAMTTMVSTIGPEGNLLDPSPEGRAQIRVPSPVLDNRQLARVRGAGRPGLRSVTLPIVFEPADGALERALEALQREAAERVTAGDTLLILSDRAASAGAVPIPSLLATAAVHQHLVELGLRTRCGLIVECGDAREVHHCALLLGYGAGAVNPYLALETIAAMVEDGRLAARSGPEEATKRYLAAIHDGILKVMSKMGISALQSYCGAQIFQAIGLSESLVDRYFSGTFSPIGGLELNDVAREAEGRHRRAWRRRPGSVSDLDVGGEYQWRRDGEVHLFTPETVFTLQHATRSRQYEIFKNYTALVDDQTRRAATIRGLLALEPAGPALPLDEVESAATLVTRFATGAMSFGSISAEAHETLAIAMNRLGGRSNSGEGGEDPARYHRVADGDSRRSAVKQIASGRFGVTSEYLVSADELQIKMSQGAKPGEGGQLPGTKVDQWIARVRHATPGVGLISPPPHHDIYSIEDLAQLIFDLRCANPRARISVKLVAAAGVGTIAAGVAKAGADVILISGHDGGTGAAPLTSIKHAGVPWELGLAETQQVLRLNDLRGRVRLQTDGQLKTGRDVVFAALLGAEEFGFATAPLVVSGCVMMRVCHLNTCPVGIATQDPALRTRFNGRPEFVTTFFHYIAEEVRELMAALGFRTFDAMVGRTDCLRARTPIHGWKARTLDLSRLLHVPDAAAVSPPRFMQAQPDVLGETLDAELLAECRAAIVAGEAVVLSRPVRNVHRSIGTMIGAEITARWGGAGLPDGQVELRCTGSAGQSFGAFIPRGLSLVLAGEANDHVGKGLSGGRIVIAPQADARARDGDIIIGNVALYGATSGEAFIGGVAGERFAVRNSGATAVIEGVGDHGCEYMTGGRVVVLGPTGRNFAAGMSGGIAWVLDETGHFRGRCHPGMVDLEAMTLTDADEAVLRGLVERHARLTASPRALAVLRVWRTALPAFVRVMPRELRAAMAASGGRRQATAAPRLAHG